MALMPGALNEALTKAGADPEPARKAAEEVAAYENMIKAVDIKVTVLDGRVTLVTWMVGFNLALTIAILWRVFSGST